MNKKNDKHRKQVKNHAENQDIQFEEMEKAEEFSITDFATGLGLGIVIGSAVVILT